MLERMERVEAVKSEKHGGKFDLKKVERTGNNVLTTEDLAIGYGEKVLCRGINISLHRGGVLGIIGANGTGKTTLLKTLLGDIRELSGRVMWGTKVNIGYYSQSLDDLYDGNDVISEFRRVAPLVENLEVRSFLARFLFFGDDIEKKVRDLSGGEKGRLALAKLIYSQKNVLVLDEPTNHLDIPAREALEAALDEYPGTIITVSHDRFFLDRIASQILSLEPDGSVLEYSGNYTEFHDWRARMQEDQRVSKDEIPDDRSSETSSNSGKPNIKIRPALSKNQKQQMERRIAEIEKNLPILEAEVERLSAEISKPDIASDYTRLQDLTAELTAAELNVSAHYEEWESLNEELNADAAP
jgi:ATP-binding cassette subfamily F protein 3